MFTDGMQAFVRITYKLTWASLFFFNLLFEHVLSVKMMAWKVNKIVSWLWKFMHSRTGNHTNQQDWTYKVFQDPILWFSRLLHCLELNLKCVSSMCCKMQNITYKHFKHPLLKCKMQFRRFLVSISILQLIKQ